MSSKRPADDDPQEGPSTRRLRFADQSISGWDSLRLHENIELLIRQLREKTALGKEKDIKIEQLQKEVSFLRTEMRSLLKVIKKKGPKTVHTEVQTIPVSVEFGVQQEEEEAGAERLVNAQRQISADVERLLAAAVLEPPIPVPAPQQPPVPSPPQQPHMPIPQQPPVPSPPQQPPMPVPQQPPMPVPQQPPMPVPQQPPMPVPQQPPMPVPQQPPMPVPQQPPMPVPQQPPMPVPQQPPMPVPQQPPMPVPQQPPMPVPQQPPMPVPQQPPMPVPQQPPMPVPQQPPMPVPQQPPMPVPQQPPMPVPQQPPMPVPQQPPMPVPQQPPMPVQQQPPMPRQQLRNLRGSLDDFFEELTDGANHPKIGRAIFNRVTDQFFGRNRHPQFRIGSNPVFNVNTRTLLEHTFRIARSLSLICKRKTVMDVDMIRAREILTGNF